MRRKKRPAGRDPSDGDVLRSQFDRSNTARLFGFRLVEASPGRAVLKMQVRERHRQIHGVVHGGILTALADTAGALAIAFLMPPRTHAATAEIKMNFLEPVRGGTVWAEACVLRRGRHLAVAECDLHDDHRRMVGKALMTFSLKPVKSPRPK